MKVWQGDLSWGDVEKYGNRIINITCVLHEENLYKI